MHACIRRLTLVRHKRFALEPKSNIKARENMINKETIEASRWMYNTQHTFFTILSVLFVFFRGCIYLRQFSFVLMLGGCLLLYAFARFLCDLFLFFSQAFLYKNFYQLEYLYGVQSIACCVNIRFFQRVFVCKDVSVFVAYCVLSENILYCVHPRKPQSLCS